VSVPAVQEVVGSVISMVALALLIKDVTFETSV